MSDPKETNENNQTTEIKEQLAKILENENVELAVTLFVIKGNKEPQVYRNGHFYDAASLMNYVLEAYRTKAMLDLGIKSNA